MISKGYKKVKAKGKIKLSIVGTDVVMERDIFERETGDTAFIESVVFSDTNNLEAEKEQIELLLDDVNELLIDLQKEFKKIP